MKKTILTVTLFAFFATNLIAAAIKLADFDKVTAGKVGSYQGPSSKVDYAVTRKQAKSGKKSLMVKNKTNDYAGVVLDKIKSAHGVWIGKKAITMWVYGSGSGYSFSMVIEDKGKEQFMSSQLKDNFKGWKKLRMPLSKFKSRKDYQHNFAKVNRKIDYPVNSLHFCATTKARFTLYFDDIVVE